MRSNPCANVLQRGTPRFLLRPPVMEAWDLMNFSKLSANEKMAVYSSAVLVVAGIISNWGGLMWLSVLAGIAVLAVVFIPQISPTTKLPGSTGTLLVSLGAIAAAGAVIEILRYLGYFFDTLDYYKTWFFAVGLIAALVLLWTGWQAFQAEGGKFQMGMDGAASVPPVPMVPPPAAPPAAPQPGMPPSDAGPNGDDDQP
jgi:hypothetical protein